MRKKCKLCERKLPRDCKPWDYLCDKCLKPANCDKFDVFVWALIDKIKEKFSSVSTTVRDGAVKSFIELAYKDLKEKKND